MCVIFLVENFEMNFEHTRNLQTLKIRFYTKYNKPTQYNVSTDKLHGLINLKIYKQKMKHSTLVLRIVLPT